MQSDENFATRLRALRLSSGMTQAAIGEVIGVKGQAINDMEHGRVKTSLDRAIQLADFIDVSLDYLGAAAMSPGGGSLRHGRRRGAW